MVPSMLTSKIHDLVLRWEIDEYQGVFAIGFSSLMRAQGKGKTNAPCNTAHVYHTAFNPSQDAPGQFE